MKAQPFQHTSKDGRIQVYEGLTAFWIVRLRDGAEGCLGDMVDSYEDLDGKRLLVDSPEFYAALVADVDGRTDELLEAYFGQA